VFVAVMTAACSSRIVDGHDSWAKGLDTARAAVAAGEPDAAARAWREAYGAALDDPGWRGLIEVAAACTRIGRLPNFATAARARARETYWTAQFRARQQRSISGVLKAAEGFGTLGDTAMVAQCIRIAQSLSPSHPYGTAGERSDMEGVELGLPYVNGHVSETLPRPRS
jgi:hypothetical protein